MNETNPFFWRSVRTPVCDFSVAVCAGKVVRVVFGSLADELTADREADALSRDVLAAACRELGEYGEGRRKMFDVPIALTGTPFRLAVWNALRKIPYGTTVTYGELARLSGSPRAARAVGGAMHGNRLPIFIPCHRVVASNGIGGFSAFGNDLVLKQRLLDLERGILEL